MVFIFQFVYMVDYVDRLSNVEPFLHLWDEIDFIMLDVGSDALWVQFSGILLNIFASMFMSEIGL